MGRASAWWVLIAGVIGLLASSTLLIEKIAMLKDPTFVPSCSINPVLVLPKGRGVLAVDALIRLKTP